RLLPRARLPGLVRGALRADDHDRRRRRGAVAQAVRLAGAAVRHGGLRTAAPEPAAAPRVGQQGCRSGSARVLARKMHGPESCVGYDEALDEDSRRLPDFLRLPAADADDPAAQRASLAGP